MAKKIKNSTKTPSEFDIFKDLAKKKIKKDKKLNAVIDKVVAKNKPKTTVKDRKPVEKPVTIGSLLKPKTPAKPKAIKKPRIVKPKVNVVEAPKLKIDIGTILEDGQVEVKMDWNQEFLNQIRIRGFNDNQEDKAIMSFLSWMFIVRLSDTPDQAIMDQGDIIESTTSVATGKIVK
jgi:hypothetical protein